MRVLLADDQLVTLEGVRIVLESSDDISVVGQAGTREELSSLVARTRPDVVLIDPQLCGNDDFACIDVIRTQHREAKVVFFSMKSNIHHVQAALEAGAAAYIIKTIHPLDLVGALRQTLQRTVFHPRLSKTLQGENGSTDELTEALRSPFRDPAEDAELKERLAQALAELPERARSVIVMHDVEGFTHAEIGELLGIPGGTARSDLHHARRKLRGLLKDLNDG